MYKLLLQLVVVVDRLRSFFNVFFKGKRKRSILCFVTTCVSVEISRSSPSTLEDHEIYVIWSLQKCISNSPCNLMTAVGMKIWLYHLRLHLEQDPKWKISFSRSPQSKFEYYEIHVIVYIYINGSLIYLAIWREFIFQLSSINIIVLNLTIY